MNRKQTTNQTEGKNLTAELSGFLDLGMKRESLALVRKILAKPTLEPAEFTDAINALGMMASKADLRKFSTLVVTAYTQQPLEKRQAFKGDMLCYFYSLGEWEKAILYLTPEDLDGNDNSFFAMELLLREKRMKEAGDLAGMCEKLLKRKIDRFRYALLIEALAIYSAATGDWMKALELWKNAPLEEPFRKDALGGIVRIHLAFALQSVDEGLQSLRNLSASDETMLSLPGNEESMTSDAEKELLSYKRRIEKLLPLSHRQALGMCD